MTEHKFLDAAADVLPVGLQPTPFGEVWMALQQVAAQVWDVDPSVYRAGIAWMWYALRNPAALDADGLRPLLVAALISEQAPLVKDTQTAAELAEYLRLWRDYTPTYPKLEALYSVFAARVEVRPVSDAESQGVVPVADRRLAFYLRVEEFDADRPLTLEEVYQIAVRATPLGSRPVPYFALAGRSDVFAGPASAGLVRALWASEPASAPPMSFVVVDSTTGKVVSGCNQELDVYELPSVVLNSEDGYETYELPSVALPTPNVVIGVPITGPVQAFWFTDEGRDETNDKTFTAVGNPLFDEDGSVARNELYDSAVPLSFMQHDGNMFEADSDSDIVRYLPVTDRLVLSIPGDSTTRDKSAWSVQVAKLFVLSYANTQLPDVQIDLPINEVGEYGTSITLPTIDGEYESGGKTWKPSAWDIGAFGSSYSLTGDVVAHLVFTEVVQYQEITLYMVNENKHTQLNVTSAFTGNVNANCCYPLYTDAECTTPWTNYDYSNEYVVGNYNAGGEWEPDAIQSVADMPDTATSSGFKNAFILMDTGTVWFASSSSVDYGYYLSKSSITLRIYPKDQQQYAFYGNSTSLYDNAILSNGKISGLKGVSGVSGAQTVPWDVQDSTLPVRTIVKILGSAYNELSLTGLGWRDPSLGYNFYQLANSSGGSRYYRSVIFTLSTPTHYCYPNNINTDTSINSSTNYKMFDADGSSIPYESNATYRVIGMFKANGDATTGTWSNLNKMQLFGNANNDLCLKYTGSGTLTFYKVWYIKTPKPIEVNFGDPVTIPAGFHVESVKCERLFVKASSVSFSSGNPVNFTFDGENEFCADTATSLVGTGVSPCLGIYALNSATTNPLSGYWLSYRPTASTSISIYSVSASNINSDGVFVKGTVRATKGDADNTLISNALNSYPTLFRYYDSSGTRVPYYFKIQSSVWQFQNGTFSWIGDTTDTSDLAYWYNGRAVQIILAKD